MNNDKSLGGEMDTKEVLDLLATRANNARIVAKRDDLANETFTNERHWEVIAAIIDDIASYIKHNSTN